MSRQEITKLYLCCRNIANNMGNKSNKTDVFRTNSNEKDSDTIRERDPAQRTDFITEFNLLSRWDEYGDVADNAIQVSDHGSDISLGARFPLKKINETVKLTMNTKIFDAEGSRVGMFEEFREYSVNDSADEYMWESVHLYNTEGWKSGWYTAEVVVRDIHRNAVTFPTEIEFQIL